MTSASIPVTVNHVKTAQRVTMMAVPATNASVHIHTLESIASRTQPVTSIRASTPAHVRPVPAVLSFNACASLDTQDLAVS